MGASIALVPIIHFIHKTISMSSKKVFIRRKIGDTRIPNDIYSESSRIIGSYFEGSRPGGRLPKDLEDKIMPNILGVSATDFSYGKMVADFYAEIATDVPFGSNGLELEIGTDKNGMPINEMDYIRYEHARRHPFVGANLDAANANTQARWYIYDPAEKEKQDEAALSLKMKATEEFMKISNNDEKLDQLLLLYGEDPATMNRTQKQIKIDEHMSGKYLPENSDINSHQQFIEYVTNKDLELMAFVNQLISNEVLTKYGNAIYEGEEKLGDNMGETIRYLKDKKNSAAYVRMKAKMEAFMRV